MELRLRATGVTCYMGSHSVTCHPTQVNSPHLNPSQTGQSSIYLPRRYGRLSRWWFTCQQTVTHPSTNPGAYNFQPPTPAESQTHNPLITSPTPTTPPRHLWIYLDYSNLPDVWK